VKFLQVLYDRNFSNGFCIVENSPKSEIKNKNLKKKKWIWRVSITRSENLKIK